MVTVDGITIEGKNVENKPDIIKQDLADSLVYYFLEHKEINIETFVKVAKDLGLTEYIRKEVWEEIGVTLEA